MANTEKRQSESTPTVDEAAVPSGEATLEPFLEAQGISVPVVPAFKRQRRKKQKGEATLEQFFAQDDAPSGEAQE
jgi:hypothetical protein